MNLDKLKKQVIPTTDKDYLVFAIVHLVMLWQGHELIANISKSLLLPTLLIWTWPISAKLPWLRLGIFASWVGDVLLLKGEEELFFMLGLGSFLIAQIAYGYTFLKTDNKEKGLLRQKPLYALPVLVLAVAIYVYLYPTLGEMLIPVSIYVCAISFMVLSAINRRGFERKGSTVLIIAVFSFMLSDALLAINKFVMPIPRASVWIMLTYIMAQYGIAQSYWLAAKNPD